MLDSTRIAEIRTELQQIGCADMVAPAGGSAPGIFGGAGLCTTEHCSSPEGVMGGERILRPRTWPSYRHLLYCLSFAVCPVLLVLCERYLWRDRRVAVIRR